MNFKQLGLITITALLFACADNHHKHIARADIQEYKSYDSSTDSVWYWYLLYSNINDTNATSPSYYYRSATPISNFSTTTFTKVNNGELPPEVKEGIQKSELVKEEILTEEQEPETVREEIQEEVDTLDAQNDAMTNEGGPAPAEADSSSGSTDSGGSSD